MSGLSRAPGLIVSVSRSDEHHFSKQPTTEIDLLTGLGVAGDAHLGRTVQHRSRMKVNPRQPNLRQVHLLHEELLDELAQRGFAVRPGDLGENITTRGIDLLSLPRGTLLRIGKDAELEVTGLRNPCAQIERFQTGLLAAVIDRRADGAPVLKAGVMAIVRRGGTVRTGDQITPHAPAPPHMPLERV